MEFRIEKRASAFLTGLLFLAPAGFGQQQYSYQAFSQIPKQDFLTIMAGVSTCLHYEPGYRISQPMLLTHGDDDLMGDIKRIAPHWAARAPNCRYVVIPNARHFAVLDNPEFFTGLLLEFLAKWAPVQKNPAG